MEWKPFSETSTSVKTGCLISASINTFSRKEPLENLLAILLS